MDQRRTDTRTQLQAVALELFAEQGYDSTSLREIAERLGITKAAVYYHFRSKDEILVSLIEDFLDQLTELVRWGTARADDPLTRVEVLRRYSGLLSGQNAELARFVREGQSALRDPVLRIRVQDCYLELLDLLCPTGDPVEGRLRVRIALSGLHIGTTTDPLHTDDEDRRRDIALAIATEVLVP